MKVKTRLWTLVTAIAIIATWIYWTQPSRLPQTFQRWFHRLVPPAPETHACPQCGKQFDHVIGVQMHIKYVHKTVQHRFGGCDKCGKEKRRRLIEELQV